MCFGVNERDSYKGMENFEGLDQTAFCLSANLMAGPMKMEQCREKPVKVYIVKDPEVS